MCLVQLGLAQAPVSVEPSVSVAMERVDATNFPQVEVYLHLATGQGMPLPEPERQMFQLTEDGADVDIQSLEAVATPTPSYGLLLLDHSASMGLPLAEPSDEASSTTSATRLLQAKAAAMVWISAMASSEDSVMLMGYTDEVDVISEMDDNITHLPKVMDAIAAEGRSDLPAALAEALEALKPYDAARAQLLVVTTAPPAAATAALNALEEPLRSSGIPLYMAIVGGKAPEALRRLVNASGGDWVEAFTPEQLRAFFAQHAPALEQSYVLSYQSPKARPDTAERVLRLASDAPNWLVEEGVQTYRAAIPAEVEPFSVRHWQRLVDRYGGYALAAVLGLLLLGLLARILRRRADANLIVPTITKIPEEVSKNSMRIRMAIPHKDKPAKFTIYSQGGKPIKDFIFKGTRRRARIRVKDLPDGTYLCNLANAGHRSEDRSFRIVRNS